MQRRGFLATISGAIATLLGIRSTEARPPVDDALPGGPVAKGWARVTTHYVDSEAAVDFEDAAMSFGICPKPPPNSA